MRIILAKNVNLILELLGVDLLLFGDGNLLERWRIIGVLGGNIGCPAPILWIQGADGKSLNESRLENEGICENSYLSKKCYLGLKLR